MLESILEPRRNRNSKKREVEKAKKSPFLNQKKKKKIDRDRSGIHVWWGKNQKKKKNVCMKLRKEK